MRQDAVRHGSVFQPDIAAGIDFVFCRHRSVLDGEVAERRVGVGNAEDPRAGDPDLDGRAVGGVALNDDGVRDDETVFGVVSVLNMNCHKRRTARDGRIRLLDRIGNSGERLRLGTIAARSRIVVNKVATVDLETFYADLAGVIVDTRNSQVCIPRLCVARVGDSVVNALLQQRNAVARPNNGLGCAFACPYIQILVGNRQNRQTAK